MMPMEEKFCKIIREYVIESHFHGEEAMADALKISVEEIDRMDPSDLAALIFHYCAIKKLPLDEVFNRMECS